MVALRRLKTLMKKTIRRALGLEVFHVAERYSQDGFFTCHNDAFRESPAFRTAYDRGIKASAGHDPEFEWRIHVALWAAKSCLSVPGDYVECGVNAGFVSSAVMHYLDWNNTGRRFYLVDTWEGPPLTQYSEEELTAGRIAVAQDALDRGAYVTDFERVRENFSEWTNAVLVRGRVPEILEQIEFDAISFLHIDMNSAAPEQAALEYLWERLSPGGMVLLDDYAFEGFEQQKLAMDDVAGRFGKSVLSLPTGQGLILR